MNPFQHVKRCLAYGCIGAFLLLPGCSQPRQSKILVQMIQAQEQYFKSEVVPGFNKENSAAVEVIHYDNTGQLAAELKKYAGQTALVKIPFDKAPYLINERLLLPLENVLTDNEMKEYRQTFVLTSLGAKGGKQYLIPRKFETRIMVYCKSKVTDALATWRDYRDSISIDLRKINGFGLPATYLLEDDPNAWDFFDIYALGWIWAHTPYNGKIHGRIAHRGKRYSGTSQRIIDRIFQCGGDTSQVLTMRGPAVTDAMSWEAAYAVSIYTKRMWEEAWSGMDIWKGFGEGEVFLAFMTQIDCFFIHGTGQDGLTGYLKDPSDMGVAQMPQGCSLLMDKNGAPVREGRKSVTTGGWWWGIPVDAPDPKESYRLARFITGTKAQINDCSRFGMIPVRKDILSDISIIFGGGWITDVYTTSFKQLMNNGSTTLPTNSAIDKIGNLYLDAWYDIVVGRNWSTDGIAPRWEYIQGVLENKYIPQAAKLLGR
jgi:ABC-type glycerol-3-phosphate transport system substrate-binding protein